MLSHPWFHQMVVGISILLDFSGVVKEKFHSASYWESLLDQVIKIGEMTKLHMSSHQFERVKHQTETEFNNPNLHGGATAFVLLSESHISVHTWPEYEKVVVDIFTCGSHDHIDNLVKFLRDEVQHSDIQITRLNRGGSF